MSDDNVSRTTEVRCRSTNGYGSGCLIAPDLVLTACHVIAPLNEGPPSELDISVRTVEDFRRNIGFRPAALIWPSLDRWKELAGTDIALLKISPDDSTRAAARPLPLGSEGLPRDQPLFVDFTGFPALMQMGETANRDTKQSFGEVALGSGAKQNILEIVLKGPPARSDEGWKGASGAAVFGGGRLIGILSVKIVGGMVDFRAVRIDAALADQAFNAHTMRFRSAAWTLPERDPGADLGRLVFLVNRDLQESAFRVAVHNLLAVHPTRPLCCLIYGEAQHRPNDLVMRFASVTIPELRKQHGSEPLRFWPIAWPKSDGSIAANLAKLQRALWNHLSDGESIDPPASCEEFKLRLCDESRPHMFSSELSPAQLTPDGAALFGAWLSFLDSVATCGLTRPPMHLITVTNAGQRQIEDWMAQVAPPEHTERHPLDELRECDWQDLDDWISRRIPKIAPRMAEAAARLKDDLTWELEAILGAPTTFSLTALKQAAHKLSQRSR